LYKALNYRQCAVAVGRVWSGLQS